MTQDRPSGSTLAEQIAAVKRVIDECEVKGYDDFRDDPHTFGHLTSMRAVLATLEGIESVTQDRPSTQEALLEARVWLVQPPDGSRDSSDTPRLAYLFDRFAAQRVTAATDKARRVALDEAARLCEDARSDVTGDSAGCMAMRIALLAMGERIRALTPQNPGIKCAIYSQVPPYRMRCEKCLAAGRCLESAAPQNPGDAEAQEGWT